MDPLSITASVAALLSLTGQIVSYAKLIKDAPKERATILREASSLNGLLATLESIIAEAEQTQWLRALLKLTPSHGIHKAVQRITWKFSKEEVVELLSQMERVKTLVGIALEIDHMFVL
jgi:hypothetical protein